LCLVASVLGVMNRITTFPNLLEFVSTTYVTEVIAALCNVTYSFR